ncbi:uncharacterized protein K444DRAFT_437825 [Hyaloscypha bicolor E]|uniref:Secreted protein n=1 Tax=Hyaloscypha bicolor E TaxID=1095630 RepID=A0A2J6T565_9HELO|nr:uncharacterized protein K444DRAFT_437825 [Hyaloscypha bicolor E]PMD58158.1 hypothetical protein K444DRAFT_437825 [Hyaloscypha bicolor E]
MILALLYCTVQYGVVVPLLAPGHRPPVHRDTSSSSTSLGQSGGLASLLRAPGCRNLSFPSTREGHWPRVHGQNNLQISLPVSTCALHASPVWARPSAKPPAVRAESRPATGERLKEETA